MAIDDRPHAGFAFRLTLSIGTAMLDRSRRALTELIGTRRQGTRRAKTTGRNKVCVLRPAAFLPGGM
jgi:GGDEF domain-containing protein